MSCLITRTENTCLAPIVIIVTKKHFTKTSHWYFDPSTNRLLLARLIKWAKTGKAERILWCTTASGCFLQAGLLQSNVTVTISALPKWTIHWQGCTRECLHWVPPPLQAHTAVKWSNETGTAADDKQTGLKSFMITMFLLLAINSILQRFLQCLLGFIVVYCIAL